MNKLVIGIGVIASVITIFVFFTSIENIQSINRKKTIEKKSLTQPEKSNLPKEENIPYKIKIKRPLFLTHATLYLKHKSKTIKFFKSEDLQYKISMAKLSPNQEKIVFFTSYDFDYILNFGFFKTHDYALHIASLDGTNHFNYDGSYLTFSNLLWVSNNTIRVDIGYVYEREKMFLTNFNLAKYGPGTYDLIFDKNNTLISFRKYR